MRKGLALLVAAYLLLSASVSVLYNTSENSWDIACARNGLLLVGFDEEGFWVLSPFCSYADVFLLSVYIHDDGSVELFSDGLAYFGEFE